MWLVLGVVFFLLKIIAVSFVITPQHRYYTGAEMLLSSVLLTAAVAPLERIFSVRGTTTDDKIV